MAVLVSTLLQEHSPSPLPGTLSLLRVSSASFQAGKSDARIQCGQQHVGHQAPGRGKRTGDQDVGARQVHILHKESRDQCWTGRAK